MELPAAPPYISAAGRDDAARIVIAIGRGQTPEEHLLGLDRELVDDAFADPLERAEAHTFADMLAGVLVADSMLGASL